MPDSINPFDRFSNLKTVDVLNEETLIERYEKLLSFELKCMEDFLRFQSEKDEIDIHIYNEISECNYLYSAYNNNVEYQEKMELLEDKILPLTRKYGQLIDEKILANHFIEEIGEEFNILIQSKKNSVKLFCNENLDLIKEHNQVRQNIVKLQNDLKFEWENQIITHREINAFLKSSNQEIRKKAYEIIIKTRALNGEKVEDQFDHLLKLRNQIAQNAGFSNYIEYRFCELRRFEWGPKECHEFHHAVKKHILPIKIKLNQKKLNSLTTDKMKPYDVNFYSKNEGTLLQIEEIKDIEKLTSGVAKIFKSIDIELYEYFIKMKDLNLLDLEEREHKLEGGYMITYPLYELTSIFNINDGSIEDLLTLLHETGHCFHYYLSKHIKPFELQELTPEVAEAGSTTLEFFGIEMLEEFLSKDQSKIIKNERLNYVVDTFITSAKVDEFQHWLYSNPNHSSEMRREKWIELTKLYSPELDYEGYEDYISQYQWQLSHIICQPFYYIDYAISELLALTLWDKFKENPTGAVTQYKKGCSLGASKSVYEIYKSFGCNFEFGEQVLEPLAKRLELELKL